MKRGVQTENGQHNRPGNEWGGGTREKRRGQRTIRPREELKGPRSEESSWPKQLP